MRGCPFKNSTKIRCELVDTIGALFVRTTACLGVLANAQIRCVLDASQSGAYVAPSLIATSLSLALSGFCIPLMTTLHPLSGGPWLDPGTFFAVGGVAGRLLFKLLGGACWLLRAVAAGGGCGALLFKLGGFCCTPCVDVWPPLPLPWSDPEGVLLALPIRSLPVPPPPPGTLPA